MTDYAKAYKILGIDVVTEAEFIEIMNKPQEERDAALKKLGEKQSSSDKSKTLYDALKSAGFV